MYFCETEKGDFSVWCDAFMCVVNIFLSVSQSVSGCVCWSEGVCQCIVMLKKNVCKRS